MDLAETVEATRVGSGSLADRPEVSVVLPCLNEEATIGRCIEKALWALREHHLRGEVVVADNGSTDRSVEICRQYGVRVIQQPKRGYGNAYLAGIAAARGRYIVIADSDDTYDLRELDRFVQPLRDGFDLVMGNRFTGEILPGAMTWSHRYVGNPILSGILRAMFSTSVGDAHSGVRAFTAEAYRRMRLSAPGMEFASEMVINAAKARLKVTEVPVTYYPRDGESKLRTVRDGWRHLRYMLLRSPTHLFLAPGLLMLALGLAAMVPFLYGQVTLAGRPFDIHVMFFAGMCALVGYQIASMGLYARLLALREGLDAEDDLVRGFLRRFRLELGLLVGLLVLLTGVLAAGAVLAQWLASGLGSLPIAATRVAFFGVVGTVLGVQTMFSSFYVATVMGLHGDGAGERLGRVVRLHPAEPDGGDLG